MTVTPPDEILFRVDVDNTLLPRQGKHAPDERAVASYPAADLNHERIGDLLAHDLTRKKWRGSMKVLVLDVGGTHVIVRNDPEKTKGAST